MCNGLQICTCYYVDGVEQRRRRYSAYWISKSNNLEAGISWLFPVFWFVVYCEGITVDELRGREVSKTVERDPVKRPAFRIMLVWMEAINIKGRKGKKGHNAGRILQLQLQFL